MEIKFECPGCGKPVEDDIENAAYDPSEEKVSDGIGSEATPVTCQCGEEYVLEVTAHPTGKTVYVRDHPDTIVEFEDDTHSEDPDY
ncbi:hypothetical protein [Agrobacterium rosae]|uniref:hypothetical protein n=1 Tax=Agrobacterium rosae TaxID=1972867 RepID=UPI0020335103|nr:hypothetical protein [Agrobacterium rosae]MCM2433196.1 hypothetical protein [Agrobacterium rosae]